MGGGRLFGTREYDDMIMESRSNIDPSVLPPSPRIAVYHGLRVYHQIKVWLFLMNSDCELMNWIWEMSNDSFSSVMKDAEPGPQDLLEMIRCNCKESCDKRCLCRKAGLKCSSSCGECLGVFCDNAVDEQNIDDKTEDHFPDRNFLDAFN